MRLMARHVLAKVGASASWIRGERCTGATGVCDWGSPAGPGSGAAVAPADRGLSVDRLLAVAQENIHVVVLLSLIAGSGGLAAILLPALPADPLGAAAWLAASRAPAVTQPAGDTATRDSLGGGALARLRLAGSEPQQSPADPTAHSPVGRGAAVGDGFLAATSGVAARRLPQGAASRTSDSTPGTANASDPVPTSVARAAVTLRHVGGAVFEMPLQRDDIDRTRSAIAVVVSGLPEGAHLLTGERLATGQWLLRPEEVASLQIELPSVEDGGFRADFEAVGTDHRPIGRVAVAVQPSQKPAMAPQRAVSAPVPPAPERAVRAAMSPGVAVTGGRAPVAKAVAAPAAAVTSADARPARSIGGRHASGSANQEKPRSPLATKAARAEPKVDPKAAKGKGQLVKAVPAKKPTEVVAAARPKLEPPPSGVGAAVRVPPPPPIGGGGPFPVVGGGLTLSPSATQQPAWAPFKPDNAQ